MAWALGTYALLSDAEMPPAPGASAQLMPKGSTVLYAGLPAPHMKPIDAGAIANVNYLFGLLGVTTWPSFAKLAVAYSKGVAPPP